MNKPPDGATVSLSGQAFFARCVRCRKLVMANRLWWGADFGGDGPGQAAYAVICDPCAYPKNEARAQAKAEAKP